MLQRVKKINQHFLTHHCVNRGPIFQIFPLELWKNWSDQKFQPPPKI